MTTIAIALFGTGVSAWLARGARRFAVIDRVRRSEPARLPRVRAHPARARCSTRRQSISSPEQVVQLWLLSAFVVGVVGIALGVAIGCGAVITVVVGGPIALHAMRHRRARAVTAAVPETLERVAAELRAGGTVASAIAWLARRRRQPHRRLRARAISGRARRPDTCRARVVGRGTGRGGHQFGGGCPRRGARRRRPGGRRARQLGRVPARPARGRRGGARALGPGALLRARRRARAARVPRDSRSSWTGGPPTRCSVPRPAGAARSPASRSSSRARGGCGASSPRARRRDPRGRVRLGDRRRRRRARLASTHRDHPPHARDRDTPGALDAPRARPCHRASGLRDRPARRRRAVPAPAGPPARRCRAHRAPDRGRSRRRRGGCRLLDVPSGRRRGALEPAAPRGRAR